MEQFEDRKEDKFEILLSTLELRLPLPSFCFRPEEEEDDDEARPDDLVKTPRSLEPAAILECPPPPRKPRQLLSVRKRKAGGRLIFMPHDYVFGEMKSSEVLFPSNLFDGKIVKKVKRLVE